MRILVVSDTHVPTLARKLPEIIVEQALDCDAILHAGDLVSKGVIDQLSALNAFYAVHGNQDSPSVRSTLPSKRLVKLREGRIGLVHGHVGQGMYTEEKAFNAFVGEDVNVIVFGHSHQPLNVKREGVLMFNPGSPVAGRSGSGNTYGILDMDSTISARIVNVNE